MATYKAYTDLGNWLFDAQDDSDAMRLALFYCWRDGEHLRHITLHGGGYTLRLVKQKNVGDSTVMSFRN